VRGGGKSAEGALPLQRPFGFSWNAFGVLLGIFRFFIKLSGAISDTKSRKAGQKEKGYHKHDEIENQILVVSLFEKTIKILRE
jgi:hypothetical protein